MSKVGSHPTCFAVIMVDAVFKNDENYYQEVFFKEFKYNEKKWLDILLITERFILMILMKDRSKLRTAMFENVFCGKYLSWLLIEMIAYWDKC